jgi:xylulokinase
LAGLRAKDAYTDHTFIGIYGLADVEKTVWSEELVQRCGLDLDKLPRITRPWEIVGAITPEVADATRLIAGTPVAAGLGDAIAGWLGVGAVEPGILVDTSGTSHHLATCVETYHPDLKNQVVTHYPSAIPGMWYSLGYTAGTGRTHRWFIDEFCLSEQERSLPDKSQFYQALEEGAARIQPGSEGLIFVPHLGGRVCPYEPDVRGTWIGFTWKHTRHHFYRALLESIAYEFFCYLSVVRQLYPDAPLKQVLSIGGGAKSKLWTQIKADVLGIPHTTPVSRQDFASLGSAIVAGHAVGLFADMAQTAKRFTTIGPRIAPTEANHASYQRFAAFYQRLFQDLEPTYARLVNLIESP